MKYALRALVAMLLVGMNLYGQAHDLIRFHNEKDVSLKDKQKSRLEQYKKLKPFSSYQLISFDSLSSLRDKVSLQLTLPGKSSITVPKKINVVQAGEAFTWYGELAAAGTSCFLSVCKGEVRGTIHANDELFWVYPIGDGLHMLMNVDKKNIPSDEPKDWKPKVTFNQSNTHSFSEQALKKTATTPVIRILVFATPAAEANNPDMTSLVNQCISSTQAALNASMADVTVELAGPVLMGNYTESGSVYTDLANFQYADGVMDNVFAYRNQYSADLMVLLVDYTVGDAIGLAAAIPAQEMGDAFCVLQDDYAVTNLTFAHEIGHLMGGYHETDPAEPPYAHGHVNKGGIGGAWRTIMAVANEATSRIPHYSNPDVYYNNAPTGVAGVSQVSLRWEQTAPAISNFRYPTALAISTISGPTYLENRQQGTWSVTITAASGNHSIQWSASEDGGSSWIPLGTSTTQTRSMAYSDYILRCVVHDNETTEEVSAEKTVYYSDPQQQIISQNVPNPFNPSTEISYHVKANELVTLKVFDVLGREVSTLVNEVQKPGHYRVRFNGANVPSGTYMYRYQAGNVVEVRRMQLLK